jgi:hypothetical protein
VTLETVVGEDTTKIRVSREKDAVHVPRLTLVPAKNASSALDSKGSRREGENAPVGTTEDVDDGRNRRSLVGVSLDTDAGVVANGEEVVDDLESLATGRVVGTRNVHHRLVLGVGVVAKEEHDGLDGGRGDVEGQLVLVDRRLLDELGEGTHDPGAVFLKSGGEGLVVILRVPPCRFSEGRFLARGNCYVRL